MIEILKKTECCGCEACINICPKECISMKYDNEGFTYPKVNEKYCIDCGLCEKVCHLKPNYKIQKDFLTNMQFYAAFNKDREITKTSSSGGVFWLLVEYVIKNKGVVYGVEQNSTFSVRHNRAETLNECEKFRLSKYLQSDMSLIYRGAKKDLESGRDVLFSGTPCQIAGLYSFLNKDYDNLITCDIVCHGVPSKAVFKKYINEVEKKYDTKVTNIIWRDKTYGWGPNRVTLILEDGRKITTTSQENSFQKGFLDNVYLRPSCYKCKYAKFPRIADISLADFWGYEGELVKENNNLGLSVIIVSSVKGSKLFKSINKSIKYHEVKEEYVKERCRHAYLPPKYNSDRERFFKDFDKLTFEKLSDKYIICNTTTRKTIKKARKFIDKYVYGKKHI